ncbi:hypothetical protein ACLQ2R_17370 [Streptosporangium sp. DT93]|uniref:hypothetical protein n=1 Tax=Streptosporangium sp. DT93 TaxID=3393428 RepID=UPI003CF05D6C
MPTANDTVRATTHWKVDRWDADQTGWVQRRSGLLTPAPADFARAGVQPYLTTEVHGNLATTAGLTRLTSLLTAGGGQAIVATSSRIGVGNGAGTAAIGDTDLSASAGSSNRWFQVLDATYPQTSGGVLTLKATFGASDGNFAWAEFGIDIGTPTVTSGATVNAVLFNHKTAIAQGTKANGQTWAATASVSFG